MLLSQLSEAGWLVIIGSGLIVCLMAFTIAVVFLASRLTSVSDEGKVAELEADMKQVMDSLKRHGILKSPRDITSPPPYRVKGSA